LGTTYIFISKGRLYGITLSKTYVLDVKNSVTMGSQKEGCGQWHSERVFGGDCGALKGVVDEFFCQPVEEVSGCGEATVSNNTTTKHEAIHIDNTHSKKSLVDPTPPKDRLEFVSTTLPS
jgi:hypothetical protein